MYAARAVGEFTLSSMRSASQQELCCCLVVYLQYIIGDGWVMRLIHGAVSFLINSQGVYWMSMMAHH